MFQFVRRLVSTFGIGLEQSGGVGSGTGGGGGGGPLSHETLAKRAQAAAQDPAFQRLKAQFAADFDFKYVQIHITHKTAIAILPLTMHPQQWAEPHTLQCYYQMLHVLSTWVGVYVYATREICTCILYCYV